MGLNRSCKGQEQDSAPGSQFNAATASPLWEEILAITAMSTCERGGGEEACDISGEYLPVHGAIDHHRRL